MMIDDVPTLSQLKIFVLLFFALYCIDVATLFIPPPTLVSMQNSTIVHTSLCLSNVQGSIQKISWDGEGGEKQESGDWGDAN